MPTAGVPRVKPIGPGALDHVGVADQLLGDRVGHVVDAGELHPVVDPALVGGVVGHPVGSDVPVEVVLGDVEDGGGVRGHRGGVVQLEAGQLDGVDRVGLGVHHRLDDRQADVAARHRGEPGGLEDRVEHLHGRGLAVGAGHAQPGTRVLRVAQPPGQLDLAPHGYAAPAGLDQQRCGRRHARGGDEHVDVVGQPGGLPRPDPDRGAEDLQEVGLLALRVGGRLGQHGDLGAEVGQVVGGREAGDADADHHRPDTVPGGVPAELVEGHTPATHSA